MASANFSHLPLHLATGAINFSTASFKCMLVTAVPSEADLDSWVYRSAVTTESSGMGYTAGGVPVTLTVGAVDTANNRVPITIASLAPGWSGTDASAAAAIIYQNTGNAATDKLITVVDFGSVVTPVTSSLSIIFNTPLYINR